MSEDIFSGEDSTVKNKMYDEKGKEIPIIDRDSMEDIDKVFTKVEVEASFPGGLQTRARYISRAIASHIDESNMSD